MLMFEAPFPGPLIALFAVLSRLSFGLEVLTPQCAVHLTFYMRFALSVCGVIVVCTLLMLGPLLRMVRQRQSFREMLASPDSAVPMKDLFIFVLLVHPTISGMAMQFFRCQTINLDAGPQPYLMVDYSLVCYEDAWYATLPLALAVLIFFSFGAPLGIAWVLYNRRHSLYVEKGNLKPQPLDILYGIYKQEAYWYEAVQMVSLRSPVSE